MEKLTSNNLASNVPVISNILADEHEEIINTEVKLNKNNDNIQKVINQTQNSILNRSSMITYGKM